MKLLYFLLAGSMLFTACNNKSETEEQITSTEQFGVENEVNVIGSNESKAMLEQQNVVVLDVRTPDEFASGHLKNAQNLNIYEPDFEEKIKALDRDKTYLIYCAAGGRSHDAAELMKELEFKHIYDANEGYEELKNVGVPVE